MFVFADITAKSCQGENHGNCRYKVHALEPTVGQLRQMHDMLETLWQVGFRVDWQADQWSQERSAVVDLPGLEHILPYISVCQPRIYEAFV